MLWIPSLCIATLSCNTSAWSHCYCCRRCCLPVHSTRLRCLRLDQKARAPWSELNSDRPSFLGLLNRLNLKVRLPSVPFRSPSCQKGRKRAPNAVLPNQLLRAFWGRSPGIYDRTSRTPDNTALDFHNRTNRMEYEQGCQPIVWKSWALAQSSLLSPILPAVDLVLYRVHSPAAFRKAVRQNSIVLRLANGRFG